MITDIDGLCRFLREYHREWMADPSMPSAELPRDLPVPLSQLYRQIGRLTELASEDGSRGPLGTQDFMAPPNRIKRFGDMIEFAWENQDCFTCRTLSHGEDPPVFSNLLHEIGEADAEFEVTCDSLIHFLITFGLREALFSSRFLLVPEVSPLETGKGGFTPLWIDGVYMDRKPNHSFYYDAASESIFMDSDTGLWLGSHRTDPSGLLPEGARLQWIH